MNIMNVDNIFQQLTVSNVVILLGIILTFVMCFKGKGVYKSLGAGLLLIASLLTVIKSPRTFESIVLSLVKLLESIIKALAG
jgi:uncharacterized membrane protein